MLELTATDLQRRLVAWHRLDRPWPGTGAEATRAMLEHLRCVQLDPLDPVATNADLVAHARIEGIRRGEIYDHLLPGHAFEHFAKELCLLPAELFPSYRDHAVVTPWWRATERMTRIDEGLIEAVRQEVHARGPVLASELEERGRVDPIDWSGWKGTGRAAKMALEVLWRRCDVVVHSRSAQGKRWASPASVLGAHASARSLEGFASHALADRIQAMGMLPRRAGPWWSMLADVRTSALPDQFVEQGRAIEVKLPGSTRSWLAHPDLLTTPGDPDDRMRLLGPLDPFLWDRALIEAVYGFRYVWEVYKPADKREWGWYVCPLLHRGELVGRVQAKRAEGRVKVERLWAESPRFDEAAWQAALERLNAFV